MINRFQALSKKATQKYYSLFEVERKMSSYAKSNDEIDKKRNSLKDKIGIDLIYQIEKQWLKNQKTTDNIGPPLDFYKQVETLYNKFAEK